MLRFAFRVLLYTIVATAIWWTTSDVTIPLSIRFAKSLHGLAGAPAPYLRLEVLHYFWLAPPVQLFVGLVLASSWISWPRRLLFLAGGLLCAWFLVALDIAVMSTPYLEPSGFRSVFCSILTEGHLIIAPVILWLILVELPPKSVFMPGVQTDAGRRGAAAHTKTRLWPRLIVLAAFCAVPVLGVTLLAANSPPEVKKARQALAASLATGDQQQTIRKTAELGNAIGDGPGPNQQLYYFLGRQLQHFGRMGQARKWLLHPTMNPIVLDALEKELGAAGKSRRLTPNH